MFKQQEFRNTAKCLPHYFMEPGLNIIPFMSKYHEVGGYNTTHPDMAGSSREMAA